jgi:transposase
VSRQRRYPSDLTDAQWALVEPLLPATRTGGRPEKHPGRSIVDGTLYVVRTGCVWRYLPADFPPWQTVYWYFKQWEQAKVTEVMLAALREQARVQQGRNPQPSAGIIDSQSVKGADTVGRDSRGYDAGKKINGRKRFIVTDTVGLLIMVVVLAASVQDRGGAKTTLLSAYLIGPIRFVSPTAASPASSSTGPAPSSAPWCTSCANPKASTASPSFRAAGASNAPWPGSPPTAVSPATTNATPPPPSAGPRSTP